MIQYTDSLTPDGSNNHQILLDYIFEDQHGWQHLQCAIGAIEAECIEHNVIDYKTHKFRLL